MNRSDLVFALLLFGGLAAAPSLSAQVSDDQPVLKQVQTFSLPGINGPFDHLAADLAHDRLFVTAETYHAVLVLDIRAGTVIHQIQGIEKPHAVLYRPDLDRIYVTDGVDGSLKIYDGNTYNLLKHIPLEKDADSIGYDPLRQLLYVVNGGGDVGQQFSHLTVVDTGTGRKVADIEIEGKTLEAMALDTFRPKLYLNDPAKGQIVVVDRWTNKIVATWPVTMGQRNVAIALDEQRQRLFTGCRSGQIVVFDTNTGKELQAIPITTGVDDLTYDPASRRIYATGNGVVDVIEQIDADHYRALGAFDAGMPARTARLVPELNRYFVAVPQSGGRDAFIAAFEPMNLPPPKPAENAVRDPISAPYAEELVLSMLSEHPDLRKLGLHAIPPGQTDSVIVANGNNSRVGYKSSAGDLAAVKDGKTYCSPKENGSFYNMKLPMLDASGRRIGILVMEIPFTSASSSGDATREAEAIRAELAKRIPDLTRLFGRADANS
ncbi:MAG TPA: YncE family protein [Acidobacteriaceae bacterium]|nr:YncE family protein [Acidobacteriaceae bacterium]